MSKTCVVVANGSRAKIYFLKDLKSHCELWQDLDNPNARLKISELVSDKAGRYMTDQPTHGAYESHNDPRQVEIARFAKEIGGLLDKAKLEKVYDNLLLFAPAYFDSLLEKHLHHKEKFAHIHKDYTQLELPELEAKIKDHYHDV